MLCKANKVTSTSLGFARVQIGVLQFSNDVYIQLPMGKFNQEAFTSIMTDMVSKLLSQAMPHDHII